MTSNATKPSCRRLGHECCYNQYLDQTSKNCSECRPGYIGWNCKQKCESAYYGHLCRSPCECPASECNHVTGCSNGLSSSQTSEFIQYKSTVRIDNIRSISSQIRSLSNLPSADRHHHIDWVTVSGLLIGSLATLLLIGCLIHFRQKIGIPDRKRIRRIFVRSRDSDTNHGQDVELSVVTPRLLGQRDGGVNIEAPHSPRAEPCVSAVCGNPHEKGHPSSAESRNNSKYNTYEKCTFKSGYDRVNLRTNVNSVVQHFDKEFEVLYNGDKEFDVQIDREFVQCGSRHHDGNSRYSLTLPSRSKHANEKKNMALEPYNWCHRSSAIDTGEIGTENLCSASDGNLLAHNPPRPYSLAQVSSFDDFHAEEEVKKDAELFQISSPDRRKALTGRPYSLVNSMR